jgi:hypothetical protein
LTLSVCLGLTVALFLIVLGLFADSSYIPFYVVNLTDGRRDGGQRPFLHFLKMCVAAEAYLSSNAYPGYSLKPFFSENIGFP